MTAQPHNQRVSPEVMLDALHDDHARVAWDILEIVPHTRACILEGLPHTWAIHGVIAIDGEVILAESPAGTPPERCSIRWARPKMTSDGTAHDAAEERPAIGGCNGAGPAGADSSRQGHELGELC